MTEDGALRTLVAVDRAVDGKLVEDLLSDPRVAVQGVGDATVGWPSRADADALLVVCGDGSEEGLDLVRRARVEFPDKPVVLAVSGSPNGFLRKAFAAGAEDVVIATSVAAASETALALTKAVARRETTSISTAEGRVITVLGPKGGTGKTLVSTNLVAALAAEGRRAVVVDLDLQFGDVGLALGLRPDRTSHDLVAGGGMIDIQKIDGNLMDHASGARALLAPTRPDRAAVITTDIIREIIRTLRSAYEYVVVDTPPAFSPEVIAALDESTEICIVAGLEAPSLKNTKLALETLDLLGNQLPVRVVLNRSDSNVGVSHSDVVHILGRAPDVLLPSSRDVVRAVNAGEPIVLAGKRNEAAKALKTLAGLYMKSEDR